MASTNWYAAIDRRARFTVTVSFTTCRKPNFSNIVATDNNPPYGVRFFPSKSMKTIRVSHGIGGSTPRSPAAFVAMVHATFDSAEVFATAFTPHAAELQA